jgi:hypothetical protein
MKGVKLASAALGLIIGVLAAVPANAWERRHAEVYAYLTEPAEGLAVASDGKIFAASTSAPNPFVIPATGCPGCTVEKLAITCAACDTAGIPIGQLLGVGLTGGGRLLIVD